MITSREKSHDASPSNEQFQIHPDMKIGHVSLNVSDLDKSLDFYKSVLGFKTVGRVSDGIALLAAAGGENFPPSSQYLVELLQAKGRDNYNDAAETEKGLNQANIVKRRAGLYHFAVLLPERKFLADMLQNLKDKRDQVYFDGLADHLVSESIYIRDPDFNGIEIYRDRPRSEWNWRGGKVEMATLSLNTADLLKETTEKGWREMPAKTSIGHVHLHVSDITRARLFYQDILGFQLTARIPSALFFAADGYHHHVAANTWLGTGIAKATPEGIGLNHFSIELPSRGEFTRILEHLSQRNVVITKSDSSDRSVFVQDTDGIRIQVQYN
jgi:catechol 2,3-dioxygenase